MMMARVTRAYSRPALDALVVLGGQVRRARLARRWTVAELASRMGASRHTVAALEQGEPTVAAGLYVEAAVLCGVALFGTDALGLSREAARTRETLALLPTRARTLSPAEVDDDF